MKVILIEDERFKEIRVIMKASCEEMAKEKPEYAGVINDAYRRMNFDFVRWAQSHGASCV